MAEMIETDVQNDTQKIAVRDPQGGHLGAYAVCFLDLRTAADAVIDESLGAD
jgi:hypothetical protein